MAARATPPPPIVAGLASAVLVLGGCAQDPEPSAGPTTGGDAPPEMSSSGPSPSRSPAPTATATTIPGTTATATSAPDGTEPLATCTNTEAGLRVFYPQDWSARSGSTGGGCSWFNPDPFELEPGTEASGVAVRLDAEDVEYDRVVRGYREDEVISQREMRVAGWPALRLETRDTTGPMATGERQLSYLADMGAGRTLVLVTNGADTEDDAQARRVVDLMAERLERTG